MALTTPVVFLIFNRPQLTARVFAAIRQARPKTLLIVADGPRPGREDEALLCAQARRIAAAVDWPCDVYRDYSDSNLGCRRRVSSGLDWAFSLVDEAIVLEDDCLPAQSFFGFCEELLSHYRGDTRVMQVCGSNFLQGWRRTGCSYYYSLYGPVWGWASWRRAWRYYDVDMTLWPEVKKARAYVDFCLDGEEEAFRTALYDKLYRKEIDTWDYQWGFAKMLNSGLSITPNVNLVSNIGFGADATHAVDHEPPFAKRPLQEIELPLVHPKFVLRDRLSDRKFFDHFVLGKPAPDNCGTGEA